MHLIFSIKIEDILKLDDAQSRELVARLCRAEVGSRGISQAGVTWGGDQRAKDGGVDVFVDIDGPSNIDGYVKKNKAAFQVKAEKFPAGRIASEMAPKGVLRPAIKELGERDGAYVIASTRDSLSNSSLKKRIKAMEDCLSTFNLFGKVKVDLYDVRRIADWVEQHPSIVVWVKHATGTPIAGWKPYGAWAYMESDVDAEYLTDDRIKIFVPDSDEGRDVKEAINTLRQDLSKRGCVRIVGLSGVGKTRLAQALFDVRVHTYAPALDSNNVIYTDLATLPTPQPSHMIEALITNGSDCVVVVDNCSPQEHQVLAEIVNRHECKVRLLTIEYDIRDDLPEGTKCYRLEGSSDEVISDLLKRRYTFLSHMDIQKIVGCSDGNARIAFALASTANSTGELGRLRDTQLFERLFFQNSSQSDELLRVARAASLLYSFDAEDLSETSEIGTLALLAGVSTASFRQQVAELQRRGLVQQRGKWRAVLPHALANRLGAQALEDFPATLLVDRLVANASERVARSFSRRLGYLHESKQAREIVQDWLNEGGRYADITSLSAFDRQIFSNVAPVHPKAALDALYRASDTPAFVSAQNPERDHYAKLARSLAYEATLFDRAIEILVRFALADDDSRGSSSTRDVLKSLFYSHLSGTEATAEQRLNVVRHLILSSDEARKNVGFTLLDAALEAWTFSCTYSFEFGAKKRGYGWRPKNLEELRGWYAPFIALTLTIGRQRTEFGLKARRLLGEYLRGLFTRAGVLDALKAAAEQLVAIDGWPEGWIGIRNVMRWDKASLDPESQVYLQQIESILAPKNLRGHIAAKVLSIRSGIDTFDDDEDVAPAVAYERAQEQVVQLGRKLAQDSALLEDLLSKLLNSEATPNAYFLGLGVGRDHPNIPELFRRAQDILRQTDDSSLIFIRGLIRGWSERQAAEVENFLDLAVSDKVWGKSFPELQTQVTLTDRAHARLLKSLEKNLALVNQYQYLGLGRVTDPLSVPQIATLMDAIASKSDAGQIAAVDVLGMVVFCSKEKDEQYRGDLGKYCRSFLERVNWSNMDRNHNIDFDIELILCLAVSTAASSDEVSGILKNLVASELAKSSIIFHGHGELLEPFFKKYPRETLDAIYVTDEEDGHETALKLISISPARTGETAVRHVDLNMLLEWCEGSPADRYIFAAQICTLYRESGVATEKLALSATIQRVFDEAPNKEKVLEAIISRLGSSGTSGSPSVLIAQRLSLLQSLNSKGDVELAALIEKGERQLRDRMEWYTRMEDTGERNRTGSFE